MWNIIKRKRKNVFVGFEEIGGNLTRIAFEYNRRGYKCYCLLLVDYWAGTDINVNQKNFIFDLYGKCYRKYVVADGVVNKLIYAILSIIAGILSLCYAICFYDNYIFDFGTSFFSKLPFISKVPCLAYFDLMILHFFKKKVIMWYMGSDSRPPYINGKYKDKKISSIIRATSKTYASVRMVERYCDYIIDNPAQAHFHQKKFIIFQMIGIPISKEFIVREQKRIKNPMVKIVHAPSAPKIKGTKYIRRIVEKLKEQGYSIEYSEIIQKPHVEVMKELSTADIVVDEVFADTPLGGLGIEAAVNKVPTVVSGYFSLYAGAILGKYMPPSCYCVPERLENELRKLLDDEAERIKLGRAAFEFAEKQWSLEQVVQNFIDIFEDNISEEWFFDPYTSDYPYGVGMSRGEVKELVRKLVAKKGLKVLHINDKPKLLEKYTQLIYGKENVL